jgi:NAD(P)H-dependent FMN reductase
VSQPKLLIIISSTRPGRIGVPVANWFVEQAAAHCGFDVELADLYEVDLPLLDEPNHPRLRQYTKEHTKAWSETVDGADAVVFVTAEYNHSFTAALKNAIDYLHHEWRHKPLGFVSYGGVAAGTRAMQALKPVAIAVALVPVVAAVNIPFVQQFVSDDGAIVGNDVMVDAASAMLDELMTMHGALAPLRAASAS